MLKRLAILGALLALAIMQAPVPMPGQAVKPAAQGSGKDENQSQGKQSASTPTPPLAKKNPTQTADPNGGQVAAEYKEHSVKLTSLPPVTIADKQKTRWDYFFDWGPWFSNALLAVVGILQVVLLYFTWKTIARQAKMQQASMMQWVDIQPIGITVKTVSVSPEIFSLTLRWKLVNNTPLPFTVYGIEVRLSKELEFWEISNIHDVEVVPPAKDGNRNFYPFYAEVDLSEAETAKFLKSGLLMTIYIGVSYEDATSQLQRTVIGEYYMCDKNSLTISGDSLGKTPEKRIEKDDSPSTIRVKEVQVVEWVEVPDPPQDAPKETEQQHHKGQNQPPETQKPN